jgi:quercetin dioxygenase-like cupin family protein
MGIIIHNIFPASCLARTFLNPIGFGARYPSLKPSSVTAKAELQKQAYFPRFSAGLAAEETPMSDQTSFQKGVPFNLKSHVAYADGSVVSKTLIKKDVGSITLFAFDAGQGLSEHKAPFDAMVTILDGQAQITIGGKTTTVNTDEMLIMPANITHALHAEKRFKMLLVMIRGE